MIIFQLTTLEMACTSRSREDADELPRVDPWTTHIGARSPSHLPRLTLRNSSLYCCVGKCRPPFPCDLARSPRFLCAEGVRDAVGFPEVRQPALLPDGKSGGGGGRGVRRPAGPPPAGGGGGQRPAAATLLPPQLLPSIPLLQVCPTPPVGEVGQNWPKVSTRRRRYRKFWRGVEISIDFEPFWGKCQVVQSARPWGIG